MELVSIIVPVYKVEKYLRRCVDSLLGQTYRNVEVVLVDDGSPDGSGAICDEYAAADNRIVVIHQENAGVSAARNAGLDAAKGDWIGFCDGDDWYVPDFVEKMLCCAQRESADYVICNYKIVSEGRPDVISGSIDGLDSGCDTRKVIAVGPMSSCTHLIHKELFVQSGVRYPVGCKQYEELPVIPVLAKYASRIGVVQEALYCYYQRGDGTSASNVAASSERYFRIAHGEMTRNLGEGYYHEAQYHAIYALLYGETMNRCKKGSPTKEIYRWVDNFDSEFPRWQDNPYLICMGKAKTLFLKFAQMKWVGGLRLLSWVHGKIVG